MENIGIFHTWYKYKTAYIFFFCIKDTCVVGESTTFNYNIVQFQYCTILNCNPIL